MIDKEDDGMTDIGRAILVISNLIKENEKLRKEVEHLSSKLRWLGASCD